MLKSMDPTAQQEEGADAVTGIVNINIISRVKGKNEEKIFRSVIGDCFREKIWCNVIFM
jgi:hypothetical protein